MSDLQMEKALKRIGEAISQRDKDTVKQLPLWPEQVRGTPNSFLRSALFPAIQGRYRKYLKRTILASQKDISIRFTGLQFDQADLDVWEQAAHLARMHPLGNECTFSEHSFLKALGRNTGKSDHEWLKDSFARLTASTIEITHEGKTYGGHLIDEFFVDEDTGVRRLVVNKKMLSMYEAGYTQIVWSVRRQLKRKPLALWLFSYYSTHRTPLPITVETLHQLSGSNAKIYKFKENLEKALRELIIIGFLSEWSIEIREGDRAAKVYITRGKGVGLGTGYEGKEKIACS